MDEPPGRSDLDPRTAEAIEQAYGKRVELDTAARHLWVLYRAAGAVGTARGEAREQEPEHEFEHEADGRDAPVGDAPSEGGSRRRLAGMRHVALSVLTGVALLATSGAAVAASSSALPGDALYVLKRGTEQVRLVIATGSGTEAQMRLQLARERWTEAKRVVGDRPELVPELVRDAVESLEAAERGEGQAAEEVDSLRRQLVDESPRVAADLDDRGREDVETSMSRLTGTDTADMVERDGDRGGVTTTELPEPGVEERTDTSAAPGEEGGVVEGDAAPESAGQGTGDDGEEPEDDGEVEDGDGEEVEDDGRAEDDGAASQPGDTPQDQEQGGADATGDDGDAGADVAEETLEADEPAVDSEEAPPDEGAVAPGAEEGLDLREEAPREHVQAESTGGEASDPEAGADGQAGPADEGTGPRSSDEGAGPRSSPTLSPDPTQRHVGGNSG